MNILRLALAQINPTLGDLSGNADKIISHIRSAKKQRADIVVFPELALTGYPPEDLVLKPSFIFDNLAELKKITNHVSGITAVVGFVGQGRDKAIYNAAAVLAEKKVIDTYQKIILPNYGVFDEFRYFSPGERVPLYSMAGAFFGINICEDVWHREGPARYQALAGADVIININASPYERKKVLAREKVLIERSSENCVAIAYLNAVGGQDELVFDGCSMVYDNRGRLIARGGQFKEELIIADLDITGLRKNRKGGKSSTASIADCPLGPLKKIRVPASSYKDRKATRPLPISPLMNDDAEVFGALVLGTSDYVRKNGFNGVIVGLSGGIDSALVATIATDALGKDNVHGLFMPSQFTSVESREDAFQLADNLGIKIKEIGIEDILAGYMKSLKESFRGKGPDTTEENLQARIRGNLLMAFSNKFGWLVLTTGNKSEMSVGYATLYGDMAGGFAVIKDVPKTLVYSLCKWRNATGESPVIPERVLWKDPTAELRPDQKDTDTLPPYEVLDPILKAYVEDELGLSEILSSGCDRECTKKVIAMVDRSEYKRRQSPPGIKITSRAFGRDRRFPITNRYRSF